MHPISGMPLHAEELISKIQPLSLFPFPLIRVICAICGSASDFQLPDLSQRLHPQGPGIWAEAVCLPRQPVHPIGPKAVYKVTKPPILCRKPIFQCQTWNTRKFINIGGHQDQTQGQSMGSYEHVIGTNWCARLLQSCTQLSIPIINRLL